MKENNLKTYDSLDIARHLIAKCQEESIQDINNTKINKLLYAVYGMYLACCNQEILSEQPKYFPYGPVFPRVYRKYDELKGLKIDLTDNVELSQIINLVIKIFGKISAGKLSTWSHEYGSPWDLMRQRESKYGESLNPFEVRKYFRKFLRLDNE